MVPIQIPEIPPLSQQFDAYWQTLETFGKYPLTALWSKKMRASPSIHDRQFKGRPEPANRPPPRAGSRPIGYGGAPKYTLDVLREFKRQGKEWVGNAEVFAEVSKVKPGTTAKRVTAALLEFCEAGMAEKKVSANGKTNIYRLIAK